MTTTIPLAQNWPEMLAMVAGYIGRTPPPDDDTPAAELRAKIEAALSEAPIPIAFNRLAQAIYDAGDAADDEVKAIGVAIMGGLSMMGTQNIGALREDLTAMRYVLMREIGVQLPIGVAYPPAEDDPWRSEEPKPVETLVVPDGAPA
ncbi:hypothetical protein [uncultured Sphingomonas sp.]|uniref:hypothetical protein n=1 Tax=uncultured Sphingomonas sp. TaxID=158754 RepID=UPI0025E2EC17|nr:hypothetical protein [uncultured Sphingomonas sp.]